MRILRRSLKELADDTANESITEIVPKVLGQYLLNNVDQLEEFYDEFPSSNTRLEMPSVSIFAKNPEFKPMAVPHLLKTISSADIVNSKANTLYVVGDYDFNLQVDLWAGSKEELDDVFDSVFNVLNPQISPMGLTLQMEEYYNILCSYDYVGHSREASEITSQTDEWRIVLNVLATCQVIRNSKDFIIESTELIDEINKEVVVP